MCQIKGSCFRSEAHSPAQIADQIGAHPARHTLTLRSPELEVEDKNGEYDGAEDKYEVKVEIEAD